MTLFLTIQKLYTNAHLDPQMMLFTLVVGIILISLTGEYLHILAFVYF